MKLEPTQEDQKINPIFIVAYSAFLLIPCLALYRGIQKHSIITIVAAAVGLVGFSFLLIVTIRHNRKVAQRNEQ